MKHLFILIVLLLMPWTSQAAPSGLLLKELKGSPSYEQQDPDHKQGERVRSLCEYLYRNVNLLDQEAWPHRGVLQSDRLPLTRYRCLPA